MVCTNMCLHTDSVKLDINVTNTADLYRYTTELFERYDHQQHAKMMKSLLDTEVTESKFAQVVGKARLYNSLPPRKRAELGLPEFLLPEAQINQSVRDYYTDENFGVRKSGEPINGWQFYNLLTNFKNNYIDTTLERSANAFNVAQGVTESLSGVNDTWKWFVEW